MKPEVLKLLAKAQDCLESAELNYNEGFYDAAVNRSYYAIFDAVTALLLVKQVVVKSHTGAIQQFAQHFVKTGIFSISLQENLIFCFQKRQKGDYDLYSDISREEAENAIMKSRAFVWEASNWLGHSGEQFS